jgi:hypothetical protein
MTKRIITSLLLSLSAITAQAQIVQFNCFPPNRPPQNPNQVFLGLIINFDSNTVTDAGGMPFKAKMSEEWISWSDGTGTNKLNRYSRKLYIDPTMRPLQCEVMN